MTIYGCIVQPYIWVWKAQDKDALILRELYRYGRQNREIWDKKTGYELLAAHGCDQPQDLDDPKLARLLTDHGLETTYYYSNAIGAWTTEIITQLDACVEHLRQQVDEFRIYWSTEEAKAAIRDIGNWRGPREYSIMSKLMYAILLRKMDENTVMYQLFRTYGGAEHLAIYYVYSQPGIDIWSDESVAWDDIWISSDLAAKPDKSTSIMRQIDRDPAGVRDALISLEDGELDDIGNDHIWVKDRNDNLDHKDLYYNGLLIADQDGDYGFDFSVERDADGKIIILDALQEGKKS